ncbi:haloacid dehalogenase-like hydrolase domain-containing protein 3 isoform X2 [Acanthaster planci]|uniref:Haloacid dehalogenase-like hydrolase domain-containing protein 3 isoform X2 n=1 Tax=Acanthaster planci TaxID=133434 RepID=A0A8B7ZZD1_ACAPL|nr:haloacid dehalogenase-like hydrolase domain-containing protein 3 isoform X2 [Acanthaster planci]XP_022110784.1 haloacid dehalogenase-like hydrolase domain-containing protein 3 isoform X2 [Acanthaster planci]
MKSGQQYSRVALQHGVTLDPLVIDKAFHNALKEQRAKHPNYGIHAGMSSSTWWCEVIRRTFVTCGYTDRETVSKIASTLYEDFKKPLTWFVFPEVKSSLTSLNRLGACLGVISNCDERLVDVLQAMNLANNFAFILLSVFTGHQKPGAEMFQMAMERLNVRPEECLHVGDNVQQDYEGARAVGMAAVVLDRDGSIADSNPSIPSDHFIPDLSKLESLVLKST